MHIKRHVQLSIKAFAFRFHPFIVKNIFLGKKFSLYIELAFIPINFSKHLTKTVLDCSMQTCNNIHFTQKRNNFSRYSFREIGGEEQSEPIKALYFIGNFHLKLIKYEQQKQHQQQQSQNDKETIR